MANNDFILSIHFTGLCPNCSDKLNYHSKKREVKRIKKHTKSNKHKHRAIDSSVSSSQPAADTSGEGNSSTKQHVEALQHDVQSTAQPNDTVHQQLEQIFWTKSTNEEEKSREEEFDDYLADLLL